MKERILCNEYWTHEELERIDGVGKLNVLKKYKDEVISRAQNLLKKAKYEKKKKKDVQGGFQLPQIQTQQMYKKKEKRRKKKKTKKRKMFANFN